MKKVQSLLLIAIIVALCGCSRDKSTAFSSIAEDNSSDIPSVSLSSSDSSSTSSSTTTDEVVHNYNNYYETLVSWTDGEDLINQLHAIIRNGYTPLTYKGSKQNYDTNINADYSKYDFEYLDVIYSKDHTFKTETNKGWQREHAWCASLMCGTTTTDAINFKGRATDFHNLFAANASGNQSRKNKNYGYADVSSPTYTTSFMTDDGNDGYSYDETTFEPGDVDKGRLARAIFYMATMYKDLEVDTANNVNMKGLQIVEEPVTYVQGNNCAFAIGNLSDLLEWNKNTPVDFLEMQHNISVYQDTNNPDGVAQGNRNPYVDFPGLVDYAFGSKKHQPGKLVDIVPSSSYLNCEVKEFSHYAIKEAKREYSFGEQIAAADYTVVSVNTDFTYSEVTTGYTNSLSNHTFAESDGASLVANITTESNPLSYSIVLDPMGVCTKNVVLSSSGLDGNKHNTDLDVNYGDVEFVAKYQTSAADSATFFIRNIGTGGVTLGSGTTALTGFSIKTKNSYTVDRVYIKAYAGNTNSSFTLTIKVGDTVVANNVTVTNNSNVFKLFGDKLTEPLTGQISFVFSGSNALRINSIAFNQIIA